MCGSCKSNWPPGKWGNVEGRKKKEGGRSGATLALCTMSHVPCRFFREYAKDSGTMPAKGTRPWGWDNTEKAVLSVRHYLHSKGHEVIIKMTKCRSQLLTRELSTPFFFKGNHSRNRGKTHFALMLFLPFNLLTYCQK